MNSREEAIEWARRSPAPHEKGEGEIELRQVFETADFPADILSPELGAREEELRKELQKKTAKS